MSATPKRRRFRFGLRGLIILTTLVCLYFACWWPTKASGQKDFTEWFAPRNGGYRVTATAVAPLVLALSTVETRTTATGMDAVVESQYFVWAFGWLAELPFTTERVRAIPRSSVTTSLPPAVAPPGTILSNPVLPTSLPPGPPVS
jgi:hypothetical protein